MSHESELEEKLATRFHWWWRGVFVGFTQRIENQGSIASLLVYSQEPKGGPAAAGYDATIGALFALLNLRRERSAFLYELQQRFSGGYEFGQPWLSLEEEQKRLLEERWPDPQEYLVYEEGLSNREPRPGWTRRITLSLNLGLHNRTLLSYLEDLIEAERSRLGIANPAPNEGMKRRPRSWRAIELLDIGKHGLMVLNNSESSQISKIRKLAVRESLF